MRYEDYRAWDHTFTAEERAEAMRIEGEAIDKMTDAEYEKYCYLTDIYVYENRCEKRLFNFCEKHGFTLKDAMIAY